MDADGDVGRMGSAMAFLLRLLKGMIIFWSVWAWACVEIPLVRILVVVANIQVRSLKTEVDNGSIGRAIRNGWVVPKRSCESGFYMIVSKICGGGATRFCESAMARWREREAG